MSLYIINDLTQFLQAIHRFDDRLDITYAIT